MNLMKIFLMICPNFLLNVREMSVFIHLGSNDSEADCEEVV